jgi:hypothetical protein
MKELAQERAIQAARGLDAVIAEQHQLFRHKCHLTEGEWRPIQERVTAARARHDEAIRALLAC